VIRVTPCIVLVTVTALLLGFGSHPWSWLAGPIAALMVWGLDRKAHEPGAHAPAHVRRTPAPVD
jgi:hypothetical protein